MKDAQQVRREIHILWTKLQAEDHPRKQVALLDQIIGLCNQHNLTHYECATARNQLAELGEHADLMRQKRTRPDK